MNNWKDTILAQYANSPTIVGLVEAFNDAIDPTADLDSFFDMIWNVETARGVGLDFWGKVVDIPRQLQVDQDAIYFGFGEAFQEATAETGVQPFNFGTFYDGPLETQMYTLTDDAYRKLILVKAMTNITDATAPSINRMLRFVFGDDRRCYVQDTGGMQMRFVFEFDLTPVEISILTRSNAIARPAGVLLTVIIQLDTATTFGFAEGDGQPFDQGVFLSEGNIINAS